MGPNLDTGWEKIFTYHIPDNSFSKHIKTLKIQQQGKQYSDVLEEAKDLKTLFTNEDMVHVRMLTQSCPTLFSTPQNLASRLLCPGDFPG